MSDEKYSQHNLFKNIILPLTGKYKETLWFADEGVAVTQEKSSEPQKPGWTEALIAEGKIAESHTKGKYVELERMLSSVVFLHLFYEGGHDAYQKLVSVQNSKEKLSWNSFEAIHNLARRIIKNNEAFNAIEAMLVYSDLGKTPKARKKAKEELNIEHPDHDDWIEAVLNRENPSDIAKVIPSFFELSKENKMLLQKVADAMKIHLGHVLHLEGGEKMFDKFKIAVSKGGITEDILGFAFLIQLCDVASSAAQVTNEGSLALIENAYQGYNIVYKALNVIRNGGNAEDALYLCLKERGERLDLNLNVPKEKLLIRLTCMMRLYDKEDGDLLKESAKQLDESSWQMVIEQFDLFAGMNAWTRNPTYIPAVLINLANFSGIGEKRSDKILRALNGAVCLAKYLAHYGHEESSRNSDTPLCFNSMAGLASKDPTHFNIKTFDPTQFEVNKKNDIIFRKSGSNSLRL